MIALTVNGERHEVSAPPRTHLADLLRDHLGLTGTHLGCEQGVCGACTVLLDGAPVRACLTYAPEVAGRSVVTVEGLDDDPVAAALRDAFRRHHALQCGYCTPGMLVTARDVVLRLGAVDEARAREELSGNLCRCTGYRGIVRALREVAADPPALPIPSSAVAPVAALSEAAPSPPNAAAPMAAPDAGWPARLDHAETLRVSAEEAWAVLSDPARVAALVPGARLDRVEGERVEGEVSFRLGPFVARLAGRGALSLDPAARRGALRGAGQGGGTRAEGEVSFRLEEGPGAGCVLHLSLGWRLAGPLAGFSRPALVRGVVSALAARLARNLEAAARPGAAPRPGAWSRLRRWWRRLIRAG